MLACLTDLTRNFSILTGLLKTKALSCWLPRPARRESLTAGYIAQHFSHQVFCPSSKCLLHSGLVPATEKLLVGHRSDSFSFQLLFAQVLLLFTAPRLPSQRFLKIVGSDRCTAYFLLLPSPPVVIHLLCSGQRAGWEALMGNCSKAFPALRHFVKAHLNLEVRLCHGINICIYDMFVNSASS